MSGKLDQKLTSPVPYLSLEFPWNDGESMKNLSDSPAFSHYLIISVQLNLENKVLLQEGEMSGPGNAMDIISVILLGFL